MPESDFASQEGGEFRPTRAAPAGQPQRDRVQSATTAAVTGTADATYSSNERDILNDLVTAVNAILVALRKAAIIAP